MRYIDLSSAMQLNRNVNFDFIYWAIRHAGGCNADVRAYYLRLSYPLPHDATTRSHTALIAHYKHVLQCQMIRYITDENKFGDLQVELP